MDFHQCFLQLTNGLRTITVISIMDTKLILLSQIEKFLDLHPDISVTRFGVEAVKDGHLIPNLRSGKEITVGKYDAVKRYIADKSQNNEHQAA